MSSWSSPPHPWRGEHTARGSTYGYPAATAGSGQRPLLFLDIDGPLIPFGATYHELPDGYPTYGPGADANPLLARLDPALGARLLALHCELVWATTWMADANTWVAPRIGLPELPVVAWPDPSEEDDREGIQRIQRIHWKTSVLVDHAAGRPFAWVDDEVRREKR